MLDVARDELAKLDTAIPEGFTEVEFANPLAKLGDIVTGEYMDKSVKQIGGKPVNTYRIKQTDGTIKVMIGAAQVDTFMDTVEPGSAVWIQRGPEIKAGKHGRVTTYRTAVRR
jgi:hypothetical protein